MCIRDSPRTQASKIGFVQQNPDNQIVTDKVWHELAFGLESLGYDRATIRGRVAEMASFFGIQAWFYRDVASLSGGQKQLLNLASVMAMQPEVLILDEPTSQLDPIAAADFLATLGRIHRDLGATIVITEHRLDEVHITLNKNTVPNEPLSPFITSGVRIGTPAATTRGLNTEDMDKIAEYIYLAITDFDNQKENIAAGVAEICKKYPLYA